MEDIDFIARYDELLDIKPSYGYKRELPKINYDEVGMELEVSVNFERGKYSFIKTLLRNIKNLVGENGYFVKDATILGDYSFEIVMDPLNINQIKDFYSRLLEIMDFSCGSISISKEKNCGIHLNFNQYDVTDLSVGHKRLTSLLSEKSKYFEENIYKQFKFIWNFDDYLDYQKNVSDKYVWVNYLDKKLIEVRNIKTNLTTKELINLIKQILAALYYDKDVPSINNRNFQTLDKIYDTAFDNVKSDEIFDNFQENKFCLISLKGKKAKVVNLPENIIEQIKELI